MTLFHSGVMAGSQMGCSPFLGRFQQGTKLDSRIAYQAGAGGFTQLVSCGEIIHNLLFKSIRKVDDEDRQIQHPAKRRNGWRGLFP